MSAPDDVLRVSTSDNVDIGYDVAGLGSRFVAQLLDGFIAGFLILVIDTIVLAALSVGRSQNLADTTVAALAVGGLTILLYIGYFTVTELLGAGRTPGKSANHLRVLDISGAAPAPGQLVLRNVARIVDVLLGVGIVVMFFDHRSRRVGDLLAGTVVVRTRAAAPLEVAVTPRPELLRTPDAGPSIDGVQHLGDSELTALRTFLSRPGLEPALRHRLAVEIAARLLDRMELTVAAPERRWPAELFLERLYLQLTDRLGR